MSIGWISEFHALSGTDDVIVLQHVVIEWIAARVIVFVARKAVEIFRTQNDRLIIQKCLTWSDMLR